MAIIGAIRGLEASIKVGKRQLQEYRPPPEDNVDDHRHATRYVVAEPGQEFCVRIKRDKSFRLRGPQLDIVCCLYIDGKYVTGSPIYKHETGKTKISFRYLPERSADGSWTKRNFLFSELVFDNDQNPPTSAEEVKQAKRMGNIQIALWRGISGERKSENTVVSSKKSITSGPVHEKALKGRALSRSAGLGEAQPMADIGLRKRKFERHDAKAFAVFTFRYRSLADLKAEMIIPRSPTPLALEERPQESLSREELLELLTRSQTENSRIKAEGSRRVKRERYIDDASDSDEPEVIEPPIKRQRVIETVDLTSD